jgi:perosamine synthetase
MERIPIAKPYITEEDAKAAYDTILTGWITQGPKVQEFEYKFAEYTGSKYAVATSSCTTALHLAQYVAGIGPGDEVICPSMSFIATANSIRHNGATPVFAEVDPETYNIDINDAERKITNRTKAILIVHQIGMPADIQAFEEICKKNKLILIEDAACAVGSSYNGQKIGSHSGMVCFSFHPRKVISTGDGGLITTSNTMYNDRLRLLRQHGMSMNDRLRHDSNKVLLEEYTEVGFNFRMTDIQAALGIKQLEKLDWLVIERRKIANYYLSSLKDIHCIRLPYEKPGYFSNYQSFSIYLKKNTPVSRNELMEKLLEEGVTTRRGIMTAHREPAYKNSSSGISLPVSEDASDNSILIPLYVPMELNEIEKVCHSIKKILA